MLGEGPATGSDHSGTNACGGRVPSPSAGRPQSTRSPRDGLDLARIGFACSVSHWDGANQIHNPGGVRDVRQCLVSRHAVGHTPSAYLRCRRERRAFAGGRTDKLRQLQQGSSLIQFRLCGLSMLPKRDAPSKCDAHQQQHRYWRRAGRSLARGSRPCAIGPPPATRLIVVPTDP